ncbi:beta-galactosidase [Paenibacillus humicola]|uniref:beta-galactosidase n=1 Tax=Paenibacillus humicola TaxID=3110540 RepID=UPI00237AF03A|nr:beta-galactosidase [Paenibacillus humicola]
MSKKELPQLPYGAVYFRKSNPPKADWERDYRTAREDGMNLFRHWFMWGAIEIAPGVFDWEDYDRQLELAAQNGIKTIIAEMIVYAPEWAYARFPDALHTDIHGHKVYSQMGGSSATGGMGGLCLDCGGAKELAGRFLTELVLRYKDHESMAGYDIHNECNYQMSGACCCKYSREKFRGWLKEKYGTVQELAKVWRRYSYTDWSEVQPPAKLGLYPETIDWLQFNKDKLYELIRWRRDLIAALDSRSFITAHGEAASLVKMAAAGSDDWESAKPVDIYGFTWVASRKGSEPWKQWHAVDLTRAGSAGKPFWHAEMQGGPLWLQPQVVGRPKSDGRVTGAEDIRLWNLTSLAGGARGLLFPRWRPLLDGPLFGAFGPYGMDGSRTDRSRMAGTIAKWANAPEQRDLLASSPIRGEIGLLVVPETEMLNYIFSLQGDYDFYAKAMWGAYRGFFDNHIQADWVHIDRIDEYDVLYFPFPLMLTREHAEKLKAWVKNGGILISEGCPAYFGDRGSVGPVQPNYGLDEMFGAAEETVEFMPDIADSITFEAGGGEVRGGVYLQSYRATSGTPAGKYPDGRTAVIEHAFGAGKTMLIGTFPSAAYYRASDPENKRFFAGVLRWSGKEPQVRVSAPEVQVRLHDGPGGKFAWILNHAAETVRTDIRISPAFAKISSAEMRWGQNVPKVEGNLLHAELPAKDAIIVKMIE